ncbi:MAG: ATP-grasp domain-containing protein, partial [Elusimicrobia bacterium]|nr:ATP-grasp domain-containing protein [Elusimicrobiota bacterium]
MARILLLLPTTTYRATDFLEAAERLRVEVTVASEEENVLASSNPEGYLALDFQDLERSARAAAELARRLPFRAVVGVDDQTSVVATRIAQELGLKGNTVESAEASRNKFLMRERLRQGGVPVPDYLRWSSEADPERLGSQVAYPCVLKPLTLAASQGVIRADDQAGFVQAWKRLQRILEVQRTTRDVLVESYIPGQEVTLEGLLDNGALRALALFDKPDPLEGPFF